MSKKSLERATRRNRVQAVFSRLKRDKLGNVTNIRLYDIYGPDYLRR